MYKGKQRVSKTSITILQFSPEVSIYSSSESDEELPKLSAGQAREVQLVYGQEDEGEMVVEADEEDELGSAPTIQLDFVPEEGATESQDQDLWQEAKEDIGDKL